jgi:hypothetical protein
LNSELKINHKIFFTVKPRFCRNKKYLKVKFEVLSPATEECRLVGRGAVCYVKNDVSKESISSVFLEVRISELGTA